MIVKHITFLTNKHNGGNLDNRKQVFQFIRRRVNRAIGELKSIQYPSPASDGRGDLRVDRLRHEAAVGGHHGVLVLGAARRRPGVAPARHQPQRRLPEPQPWRGVGIYIIFWLRLSVCMYACLFKNHLVSSQVFTL